MKKEKKKKKELIKVATRRRLWHPKPNSPKKSQNTNEATNLPFIN